MGVERAVGQPRLIGDFRHADAVDTPLTEEPVCRLQEGLPIFSRLLLGDTHLALVNTRSKLIVSTAIKVKLAVVVINMVRRRQACVTSSSASTRDYGSPNWCWAPALSARAGDMAPSRTRLAAFSTPMPKRGAISSIRPMAISLVSPRSSWGASSRAGRTR